MLHKTLIASLLGLALVGCGQQDPQAKVSAALTDGVLLPAYSSWQEVDRQFVSARRIWHCRAACLAQVAPQSAATH